MGTPKINAGLITHPFQRKAHPRRRPQGGVDHRYARVTKQLNQLLGGRGSCATIAEHQLIHTVLRQPGTQCLQAATPVRHLRKQSVGHSGRAVTKPGHHPQSQIRAGLEAAVKSFSCPRRSPEHQQSAVASAHPVPAKKLAPTQMQQKQCQPAQGRPSQHVQAGIIRRDLQAVGEREQPCQDEQPAHTEAAQQGEQRGLAVALVQATLGQHHRAGQANQHKRHQILTAAGALDMRQHEPPEQGGDKQRIQKPLQANEIVAVGPQQT